MNKKCLIKRIMAALVDFVIGIVLFVTLYSAALVIISSFAIDSEDLRMLLYKNSFINILSAIVLLKDISGVSLGKLVFGLRIIDSRGTTEKVNVWRRVVRNTTFWIIGIEFIAILVSGTRISDDLLKLKVVEKQTITEAEAEE